MTQANDTSGTRVSVVINTYNRGPSLRRTLDALRYQTHDPFEVIVVNGPSTDNTEEVLADYPDVRTARCPEVHLSRSRNVGVAEAVGDIIAFIDDDALPEPTWLAELAAAYDSPRVGGAGGVTFDHTGFQYQYQYSVCDRLGKTRFDVRPPFDAYNAPGADPVVYLQGTNCSFRRPCLVEIGGFDEEIEYYMDEVDVCRRVIDLGYVLRPLASAAVHHKYLASHLRNSKKVVFDPYPNVKNHCYLAILNNRDRVGLERLKALLHDFADGIKAGAHANFAAGKLSAEQRDRFLERVEQGLQVGIEKGVRGERLRRLFPEPDPGRFRPYRALRPEGGRLKVCFISQEYPPGDFGGIGRFTCDLAAGFAAQGHEVHVITRSPDVNRVDLEEGVWMHRLAAPERYVAEVDGQPVGGNLAHSCAVYQEVLRIHQRGPVDVVSAPLWACEGLPCALDRRFPTVLTLMTSMQTIASMHPSWRGDRAVEQAIGLERATARRSRFLHPISRAILEKVRADYRADGRAEVLPLGARDRRADYPPRRGEDGKVRVLFVGRLERRKGVDVLLEAAVSLLGRFPAAEFVLAGKDTPNTETGETYRATFERRFGHDPAVSGRVHFTGAVSEDELYRHYADADIVVLPSRYESFGLVLVEGMMFGKPVVGCSAGGMTEIVEEGGNGFLAQPGDAGSLADCLAKLLGDAELRSSFGERSRALYEEKFALPVVVANTVSYYRRVAAWHRSAISDQRSAISQEEAWPSLTADRCSLTAPAEALGGVIEEVAGLGREAARRAARRLLDPSCYPVDYVAVLRRLWQQPDEGFVTGVYHLLLGREPDADGREHYLAALANGMPRAYVVRSLALSDEARQAGRPTDWVDVRCPARSRSWRLIGTVVRRLLGRGPAPEVWQGGMAMPFPPPSGGLLARAWRKLRAAASPGKVARYIKRAIYLPWNFQKLYDGFVNVQAQFRLQTEAHERLQRAVSDRIEAFIREVYEKQAQLERQVADTLRTISAEGRDNALLVQQEARQLKYRYAEFYGALAETQKDQTRALHELTRCLEGVGKAVGASECVSGAVGSADGDPLPMPRVVTLEGYRARAGRSGDTLRVNLACGSGPLPGYVNVDIRPGPRIDV
ncbi:MAG: glycosyltransferase, partial [Gemmataceae bacterium]|nr:glycosyltransferase [Gemmataceae bacterium]